MLQKENHRPTVIPLVVTKLLQMLELLVKVTVVLSAVRNLKPYKNGFQDIA